mmetsp:Transcript_35940/g.38926  ORF Transcript_35940/g.38926 Transcript_35940/m.38926 type:complete len:185 (+) Transcript_35940:71-625(+)
MSTTITKDEADAATADTAIVDATGEEEKEEEGSNNNMDTMKPLFETLKDDDNAMLSFADGFRDKVKILFEKFDVDEDGYLNYEELAALQQATSDGGDNELSKKMYVMVCQSLNCHPDNGLSLGGLKFTYASEGADIDIDYDKVFHKKEKKKRSKKKKKKKKPVEKDNDDDDKIYEVGVNGVDIS